MLPLQPKDAPELSAQKEKEMAQDLAERFSDYVCNELVEVLSDLADDILKENNIDPGTNEGMDLMMDLVRRVYVGAN